MRDLKFARYFPAHHPRKGEPTHFLQKIWANPDVKIKPSDIEVWMEQIKLFKSQTWTPKRTTIRAGHRFKAGDWFQPKAWTGLPYRSKPVAICEPLQVLKVEMFMIDKKGNYFMKATNDLVYIDESSLSWEELIMIALDDGFDDVDDFELWFNWKPGQEFDGQRIWFA